MVARLQDTDKWIFAVVFKLNPWRICGVMLQIAIAMLPGTEGGIGRHVPHGGCDKVNYKH